MISELNLGSIEAPSQSLKLNGKNLYVAINWHETGARAKDTLLFVQNTQFCALFLEYLFIYVYIQTENTK